MGAIRGILLGAAALLGGGSAYLFWQGDLRGMGLCLAIGVCLLTLLSFLWRHAARRERREVGRLTQCLDEAQADLVEKENLTAQVEQRHLDEMEQLRSDISHSLRVPLSIIQGYADLLQGNMVEDEMIRREYLDKIVQRSKYASDILGRHISKDRSEEDFTLTAAAVDVLDMMRQAVADFQTSAGLRGVVIQVVSGQEQVMADVDPCQLTKVFFNLMENAVKYMGREGIVTIRVFSLGEQIRVVVKDDGLGLDTEETCHIFEMNFQGSNRATGHGHGLYLTRRIVEAHGGTIAAQSSPGQGMGITITLPVHRQSALVEACST